MQGILQLFIDGVADLIQFAVVLGLQGGHALGHAPAQLFQLLGIGCFQRTQTAFQKLLLAILPLCQRRAHVLHRSLQRLADTAQGGVILLSKGRLPGRKLSGLRIQLLLHPALELVVIRYAALLFAGAPEHHGQFQADDDQQKGVKSCQIFHKWFSPIIKIRVPQKAGPGVFYSNS